MPRANKRLKLLRANGRERAKPSAAPHPITEPSPKVTITTEPSFVTALTSQVHQGLSFEPLSTSGVQKELWFDQCVYQWKDKEAPGQDDKREVKETGVDEPSLLLGTVQKWLIPSTETQDCVWLLDLRFDSLCGGWLDFYKRNLPLCTVPLLLRERSLQESGRAIFERTSLRPRDANQARESLHFLAAKTEDTFSVVQLRKLLVLLKASAGPPAVILIGWSASANELQEEVELRDAFAAASLCDKKTIFLLSLPDKPSRPQQLALFLFSSSFHTWKTLLFKSFKTQGKRYQRFLFVGKGLPSAWAKFFRTETAFLCKESVPATEWLERALNASGLSLQNFWAWKVHWRKLEMFYRHQRLQFNGSQALRIGASSSRTCENSTTKRILQTQDFFYKMTVKQWLSQILYNNIQVADLLHRWATSQDSPKAKRSFLWSDQQYTWESSCTADKSPPFTSSQKWFANLNTKLQKKRPLPPHSFLLLEDSHIVVDLLLFPELNEDLQHKWTRRQRLSFVDSAILPAQALRVKVLAQGVPQCPLQIWKEGEDSASHLSGWEKIFLDLTFLPKKLNSEI